LKEASRLAAKIKSEKGVDVELVKGSGGIYDVYRDDTLIYSKHKTGKFPLDEEVLSQLP
jgi:selenoprotein W-related protein